MDLVLSDAGRDFILGLGLTSQRNLLVSSGARYELQ